MGFNKKGKRKIRVLDEDFYWWINKSTKGRVLHLLGLNKKFNVEIGLDDPAHVKEHALPKLAPPETLPEDLTSNALHDLPKDSIKPKDIRKLILWYLYPNA